MSSEEPQKTGLEEKQHSNSILLLKNKDLNRNLSPLHLVAGVAGFEPTNDDTKNRCLTTWRHPIHISVVLSMIFFLLWQEFF